LPGEEVELRIRLSADHLLARDEEDLARLDGPDGRAPVTWQPIGVDVPSPTANAAELREPARLATVVHLGHEEDVAVLLSAIDPRDTLREVLLLVPDRPAAVGHLSARLADAIAVARARGVETRLVGAHSACRRLELLHSTSVFVYAPHDPPSDRAVVEAMSAGCLVVAGNNGRLSGLVHDGIDGLVVEAGSERSLRSALAAGAHPAVAAQLGQRAAREAEERYSWAAAALRAREVFKSLLDGRR
jgi:glycosyltransferase involved in cell wall biosynthesis